MNKLIESIKMSWTSGIPGQGWRKSESGQGILEYALIFVLVVVLLIVLLYFFGDRVEALYQSIVSDLSL